VAPRPAGTRVMPAPPAWVPRRPRRLPRAFTGLVLLVLTFLAGVLYAGAQHSRAQADPAPGTHSPSPSPSPTIGCAVTYTITASIGPEFGAELRIENTGPLDIDGWTLVFDLPDDQTLRFGWSGRWQQDDRRVTVKDAVYNRSLTPGKSITIGFAGSHGDKTRPKRFTVNGARCITAS
jgi:Cellulose binding domain